MIMKSIAFISLFASLVTVLIQPGSGFNIQFVKTNPNGNGRYYTTEYKVEEPLNSEKQEQAFNKLNDNELNLFRSIDPFFNELLSRIQPVKPAQKKTVIENVDTSENNLLKQAQTMNSDISSNNLNNRIPQSSFDEFNLSPFQQFQQIIKSMLPSVSTEASHENEEDVENKYSVITTTPVPNEIVVVLGVPEVISVTTPMVMPEEQHAPNENEKPKNTLQNILEDFFNFEPNSIRMEQPNVGVEQTTSTTNAPPVIKEPPTSKLPETTHSQFQDQQKTGSENEHQNSAANANEVKLGLIKNLFDSFMKKLNNIFSGSVQSSAAP